MVSAFLLRVRAIKGSVIACGIVLALGLLGMGSLGILLYYLVSPVLSLRFPSMENWHGDWVWPAVIGVGMAWSFGFLVAGVVNYFLMGRQISRIPRRLIYLGILWLWDLVVWFLVLAFAPD